MKAELLRQLTRRVPMPGRLVRRWIDRWEALSYPARPTLVTTRAGCFEVRDYREYIQRNIYFQGRYEIRETRLVERWLRPGDTFVDVGANIGWFTLLAARIVGTHGKVIAFEPSPPLHAHLQHNIELNDLEHVRAQRCAVGAAPGRAVLRGIRERNQGTGSIVRGDNLSEGIEVDVVTLDGFLADTGTHRVRMLKIDVEGAEGLVLQGAADLLKSQRCDCLIIEVVDSYLRATGGSSTLLCGQLRAFGYRLFRIGLLGQDAIGEGEQILQENIFAVAPHARRAGTTTPRR
jgi:FkbM family methyltransferase